MKKTIQNLGLPLVGISMVIALWSALSGTVAKEWPSPLETWEQSKLYITAPWEKRGEMDQGILRMASYSLWRVAKGYLLALLIGTPVGFLLGRSQILSKMFDPVIQVLRPIS